MKYCFKSSLLVALALLFSVTSAPSSTSEGEECMTCHGKTYDKSLHKSYIHSPFLDKKCTICHLAGNSSSLNKGEKSSREDRPKVTWLQKHYEPARTHFFLFPSSKVDDTLFIQVKDDNGRPKTTSISLPPIKQLPQLENDNQKPRIYDIQFHGVRKGLFHSATISWKTDEPSDAQIHYGIGAFNHKTRLAPQLKNSHVIDISPVTPRKIYDYTVVSKDMHGNRMISQPSSFSTKKIGRGKFSGDSSRNNQFSSQKEFSYKLSAVGDQYFITITASQSTYMGIGSRRYLRQQINMTGDNGAKSVPGKHVAMKSTYDTNIKACLDCHKDYKAESSHPINVRPKRGMVFPKDYPVLDDGRMHCMTCHDVHASNNEDRIRRRTKKELCVGCHRNYG